MFVVVVVNQDEGERIPLLEPCFIGAGSRTKQTSASPGLPLDADSHRSAPTITSQLPPVVEPDSA